MSKACGELADRVSEVVAGDADDPVGEPVVDGQEQLGEHDVQPAPQRCNTDAQAGAEGAAGISPYAGHHQRNAENHPDQRRGQCEEAVVDVSIGRIRKRYGGLGVDRLDDLAEQALAPEAMERVMAERPAWAISWPPLQAKFHQAQLSSDSIIGFGSPDVGA